MAQNRDASRRPSTPGRGSSPRPQPSNPGYSAVPPRRPPQPRPSEAIPRAPRPVAPPTTRAAAPAPTAFAAPPGIAYEPSLDDDLLDLDPLPPVSPGGPRPPALWHKIAKNWTLWSLVSLTAVGGVGIASAVSLFRIPNLPNCRAIFWPTASATTRIQCAQAYADQGTVEGYLEAIKLVEKLPDDHPLRPEINQRVEEWASKVLDLAEQTFQSGKLEEAISFARRIPSQTAAAGLVNDRVASWKKIWEEAEGLYSAAETDLKNRQFNDAFNKAIQLLNVGNRYWETTKYDELTKLITTARADLNKLGEARRLAKRDTLESFVEAIKLASSIQPESPMHAEAQDLLREFGRDMLDLAEESLARKDTKTASEILKQIPSQANLGEEIADFRTLTEAYELSWQGGATGLEGAIVRLQSIGQDRPLYARAQTLISRWQTEIEGRSRLDWARQVANPGTIADLEAAIAEADRISRDNPVWDEARDQIADWKDQIATAQDRPYLNQAEQLAQAGDLSKAIDAAQQVSPGRPLYSEAQKLVDQWQSQLERTEDAPILAQARELATAGRYQEAVAVASQIGSNRSLYSEAQDAIDDWQGQLKGQQSLQAAYRAAEGGTVDALVNAITLAQGVPESSPQYSEAQQVASRWSWDIFRLAESEVPYSLERAIAVASKVPPRTEAYAQAQLKIKEWRGN